MVYFLGNIICYKFMKKLTFSFAVIFVFLFSLFLIKPVQAGPSWPGAGSGTEGDPYLITNWTELNTVRDFLDSNYKLTADLGTSTVDYVGIGDSWSSIGSSDTPFTGVFDGNGHRIVNLIVNSPSNNYVGLFSVISMTAKIKALGLDNVNIDGKNFVGGLVGDNRGYIYQCYTTGSVTGEQTVGGLVGGNSGAGAYVVNSYSTASASSIRNDLPYYRVGGLVGGQDAYIRYSYSSGQVSLLVATSSTTQSGGLLGTSHDAVVDSSFWDMNTSGYSTSEGGSGAMGITTAQMASSSTFTAVGWNFDDIWTISNGYPHFQWEFDNPYVPVIEIRTCQELQNINNLLDGNYSISEDIDCYSSTHLGGLLYNSGSGFTPLGTSSTPFSGILNGNGHKISYIFINRPDSDYVGLFGAVGTSSIIKNIGVVNVEITGANAVGGLVGQNNNATISSTHSSGVVTGSGRTGGLVGLNNGDIFNSYSSATTTSDLISGGLVGENNNNISNSFSFGVVGGRGAVGGLVATSTGGSVINSFWDTEASSASTSATGTGKTTSQLKTRSTFTGASWNFDTTWGIDTNPEKNNGYPYLLWQAPFVLRYEADSNGSISGPNTQFVGYGDSPVSVEAVPDVHYEFTEWSDGGVNPTRTENQVYGNKSLTAMFSVDTSTTFTVEYTAGEGGSISGSANQSIIYDGSGTSITAVPNSGYYFVRWSDNGTTNPRTETEVKSDMTISAVFSRLTSSGGGSSGGGLSNQCSLVVYSDWQPCVGDKQFRSISSSLPTVCTLTVTQQLGAQRTCSLTVSSGLEHSTSTTGMIEPEKSSSSLKMIIDSEKGLTNKTDISLIKRLAGRILLQTEQAGQAWYLDPLSLGRYYLADGSSAYNALRKFALGVKDSEIIKIPVGLESRFKMTDSDSDGLPDKLEEALGTDPNKADTDGDGYQDGLELGNGHDPLGLKKIIYSNSLINRLKGRILIQTEKRGQAWYVNPVDGKRYYLANGEAAYQIMRYLSLGINNDNIRKIKVGE